MSQFERPPINQSKQALSNMLRQRQPHGVQANPQFTMQQQQQQRMAMMNNQQTPQQLQQLQQQQRQQQLYRARMASKPMPGNPNALPANVNPGMVQQTPVASMMDQQNPVGMMQTCKGFGVCCP